MCLCVGRPLTRVAVPACALAGSPTHKLDFPFDCALLVPVCCGSIRQVPFNGPQHARRRRHVSHSVHLRLRPLMNVRACGNGGNVAVSCVAHLSPTAATTLTTTTTTTRYHHYHRRRPRRRRRRRRVRPTVSLLSCLRLLSFAGRTSLSQAPPVWCLPPAMGIMTPWRFFWLGGPTPR
jgi:hypothetical protein